MLIECCWLHWPLLGTDVCLRKMSNEETRDGKVNEHWTGIAVAHERTFADLPLRSLSP
jgi:hypothetical protein